MNSKNTHAYDALLALRNLTDRATPVTASGQSTGSVTLHRLTAGRGDLKGLFGQTPFDVVIGVDALTTSVGDETYTVAVKSVDANGANPMDVPGGSVTLTAAEVGQMLTLKLDPASIARANPAAAAIVLTHTLGGAHPSATFYAFAAPNAHTN